MEYFVAYELEGEAKVFSQLIREEISDKFGFCKFSQTPPHIVLKEPFERDNSSSVERLLYEFSDSHRPVAFGIDGINLDDSKVYLNILPSVQMNLLSAELLKEFGKLKSFLKQYKLQKVFFHSVICKGGVKDRLSELRDYCDSYRLSYQGSLDGFTLFCLKDRIWEVENRYQLKGFTTGVIF